MDHKQMARLADRAKQGDEDAFAKIYRELSQNVYYIGLKMLQNEFDAKDVAQETMLKLHMVLANIKDMQSIVSYVNRMATNRCLNLLHQKNPLPQNETMELALENAVEESDEFIPESFLEKKEQRDYIIGLIDGLEETQKTVVLLYYYKRFSSKEIAEMLAIEEGAVRKRLSRARVALKKKLIEDNGKDLVSGMGVPVLTRILQMDAEEAFTREISKQIWHSIGSNLGYSAATIAATTPTAIGIAATAGSAAAISAAAVAATALITTVVVSVAGGLPARTSIQTAIIPQTTITQAASVNNNDIPPEDTLGVNIPSLTVPPGSETTTEKPDGGVASNTLQTEEAEATYSAPPSSGGIVIVAKTWQISYPVGAKVTPEQILRDAGVSAVGPNGKAIIPNVIRYEEIDFEKPDRYFVYARIGDRNTDTFKQVVIEIRIV